MNEQTTRIDQKIQAMATRLSRSLDSNMRKSFLPDNTKELRHFNAAEAAELIGVSLDHLRKQFFNDKIDMNVETDMARATGRSPRQTSAKPAELPVRCAALTVCRWFCSVQTWPRLGIKA